MIVGLSIANALIKIGNPNSNKIATKQKNIHSLIPGYYRLFFI